jgi:hypothetical protein
MRDALAILFVSSERQCCLCDQVADYAAEYETDGDTDKQHDALP